MKRNLLLIFFIATACSWQSHITRYMKSNGNFRKLENPPQLVQYQDTIRDTIVTVKEQYDRDSLLYSRSVQWPHQMVTDTFYYRNGNYYLIAERKLLGSSSTVFDYSCQTFFDRKGRPLYKSTYNYQRGKELEYRQFYNKSGQLLPEKHDIPIEIH